MRFGTERLYAQKEDLLHEVLELEAEKNLMASGEGKYQDGEIKKRTLEELTLPEPEKPTVLPVAAAAPTGEETITRINRADHKKSIDLKLYVKGQ